MKTAREEAEYVVCLEVGCDNDAYCNIAKRAPCRNCGRAIEAVTTAIEQAREDEREACLQDCYAEYRDDGAAQRIVERIKARAPSGDGEGT